MKEKLKKKRKKQQRKIKYEIKTIIELSNFKFFI